MTSFHLRDQGGWTEFETLDQATEAGTTAIAMVRRDATDGVWPWYVETIVVHRTTDASEDPAEDGIPTMRAIPVSATPDATGRLDHVCDYVMAPVRDLNDDGPLVQDLLSVVADFVPDDMRASLSVRMEAILRADRGARSGSLRQAILKAVRDYRLSGMRCEGDPDWGYPLVDLMTPDGPGLTIAEGETEIELLTDEIMEAVRPAGPRPVGIGPAENDRP